MKNKIPKALNVWGVPNQIIITTREGKYFQSYDTTIAFVDNFGRVILDINWKYSKTTSKYLHKFLGVDTKTIQNKVNSGEYIIRVLN